MGALKYIRLALSLLLLLVFVLTLKPLTSSHNESAFAEQFDNAIAPYSKIFTISAYYSPLPCQNKYVTGSYEGDRRLNGYGVHGADGTDVYPGMIAAPSSYSFGTKMDIPGVGIVAVHDRGGAIKASNGQDGVYDRLDLWMGYGDKGLKRALNWGKRTMDVVVYGVNDGIAEQIILDDFSPDEAIPNECVMPVVEIEAGTGGATSVSTTGGSAISTAAIDDSLVLNNDLKLGDSGSEVMKLQKQLKNLNLFKADITGYYGEVTQHAVFKFQQIHKLVADKNSLGAGIFGPKTRDNMNEIINSRNYTNILVVQANLNRKEEELVAKK